MVEVLIRTILIYLILLLVVRLMGKRMSGQITLTEMAVMITLGAIVSPVMQLPDRGILFGVIALGCALIFQRQINLWGFLSPKVEEITQGEITLVVKDGKLIVEELEKTALTRQQLYAMLREKKIYNLAEVDRAYLEACGILSVYTTHETKPGLPIYPEFDKQVQATQKDVEGDDKACCGCGNVQRVADGSIECNNCGASEWSKAYLSNNLINL